MATWLPLESRLALYRRCCRREAVAIHHSEALSDSSSSSSGYAAEGGGIMLGIGKAGLLGGELSLHCMPMHSTCHRWHSSQGGSAMHIRGCDGL